MFTPFTVSNLFLTTCVCIQRPITKAGTKLITGQASKSCSQSKLHHVQVDTNAETTVSEEQWPRVARLCVGGLSQQGRVIREICRDAIQIVEVTLVTVDSWPELHQGTFYKRQILLEAVNALRAKNEDDNEGLQDSNYNMVRTRILEDEKFIRIIDRKSVV